MQQWDVFEITRGVIVKEKQKVLRPLKHKKDHGLISSLIKRGSESLKIHYVKLFISLLQVLRLFCLHFEREEY